LYLLFRELDKLDEVLGRAVSFSVVNGSLHELGLRRALELLEDGERDRCWQLRCARVLRDEACDEGVLGTHDGLQLRQRVLDQGPAMRAQFSTVISAARVEGFGACGLLRLLGRLLNCVCRARRKDDAHCRGRDTLLDDGPTAECAHSQSVAGSDEREHEHGDRSRAHYKYAKQNSESRGTQVRHTVTLRHL